MSPKEQHEKVLRDYVQELEAEGHRVIILKDKKPDAICVDWQNQKIYAVECLGKSFRAKGKYKGKYAQEGRARYSWRLPGGMTFAMKRKLYSMFDDVLFCVFYRKETDTRELTEQHKQYQEDYMNPRRDMPQ